MLAKIRQRLAKVHWLALLYRKYVRRLPMTSCYADVCRIQHDELSRLSLNSTHVISFIYLLNEENRGHLDSVIRDLTQQSSNHWQLIIIGNNAELLALQTRLELLESDARFKIVDCEDKSLAFYQAVKATEGQLVCFLHHAPKIHYHFVSTLQHHYQQLKTDFYYVDHDHLSEQGDRVNPELKPDWNPDLFLSKDNVSQSLVIDREYLLTKEHKNVFSFDGELYRLLVSQISSESVSHIPYVLFHQRLVITETSQEREYKTSLLQELSEQVEPGLIEGSFHIKWPLPKELPLVSIIIPTKNGFDLVKTCLSSLYEKTQYTNFEVILVDNGSDDAEAIQYFSDLAEQGKVNLLSYDAPFNYSAINNFAVKQAKGDVLVFMNNDIEVISEHWLDEMVAQALRPDIGCVGAKLFYPNDLIQHAGVIIGLWGCAGHSHKLASMQDDGYCGRLKLVQNYSAVTAACLAIRKETFWAVDGFNAEDLAVAFNDVDLCLKVEKLGYRNLWTPYAELYHYESISRGPEDTPEKKAREQKEIAYMRNTWKLDEITDPAYNPWLTQIKEDFSIGDV